MFKNIRIAKRGGGTRLQRVKVLASGKYKFVKNVGTKRSSKTRRRSNPKRRVKKTARRRRNPGRSSGFSTRTIFKFLRWGALIAPGANEYMKFAPSRGPGRAAMIAFQSYAGLDANNRFNMNLLTQQWTPFLLTTLITYGIGKLGGILRRI